MFANTSIALFAVFSLPCYHYRLIPGDCNFDGHVDATDLSILQNYYNQAYYPCDFNIDGIVNSIDLSILLSNYGKY